MNLEELSSKLRIFNSALHKVLRKEMALISTYSMTEQETLVYIFKNRKMLPSDLAAITRISLPSMSQILKRMQDQGIIKKTPSAEDKRNVYVSLTTAGSTLVEKVKHNKDEYLKQLISTKLSDTERALLKKAMPLLAKLIS